jgi:hypothetical protein
MKMGLFPKAAFMRLRYPQKFILISLLFALPLAVVLFLLAAFFLRHDADLQKLMNQSVVSLPTPGRARKRRPEGP